MVLHLQQAEALEASLQAGEFSSRTALARHHRLTKPRVTQLLDLLRLDPRIREFIRTLPAGTPERLVTERQLRRLVRLPPGEQVRVAERRIAGFAACGDVKATARAY